MPRRLALALALAATGLASVAARADEIRGPRFGTARITSEIRTAEGEPDEDVYVESLAAGESLQVRVKAAKGSELRPVVTVHGPDGDPRDTSLRIQGDGRSVRTATLPVDATGRWVVRVAGTDGTEGAYTATFKIKKARAQTWKGVAVPAPGSATLVHPFQAVEGALATVKMKSSRKGAVAEILRVLDPKGGAVPGSQGAIRAHKSTASISKLALSEGDGEYGLLLASPDGPATVTIKIKTRPPAARPRGKLAVDAAEPYLPPLDEPLEGEPGKALPLAGKRLPDSPLPEVWFGELRGSVVGVNPAGTEIDVIPPGGDVGAVVSVAIVTAEGQCARRPSYFSYLEPAEGGEPPPSLELASLSPPVLAIDGNDTQLFDVTLSENAPSGGVWVDLAVTGDIGQVAPRVRVPGGRTSATFLFGAVDADRTGTVVASLGTSAVTSHVTVTKSVVVEPPVVDEIDLTGWQIRQAASTRSFTIPNGTKLQRGQYLVLARNSSKSAFETFWGVTLGQDVVFLSSTDYLGVEVPTVNGSEVYTLYDGFGIAADGPTIAMASSAGQNLQRTAGTPAGSASSWTVTAASGGGATPGGGIQATASGNGVYVSEFSDAAGAGNYVYEFVELHYDGAPD